MPPKTKNKKIRELRVKSPPATTKSGGKEEERKEQLVASNELLQVPYKDESHVQVVDDFSSQGRPSS